MRSLGLFDDLLHDARYALRVLRRDAAFTCAVVLTLALGIGANAAVFSLVNAVLLRPLPYTDPDRLVGVWTSPSGSLADRNPTSLPDIDDWRRDQTVFAGIAGYAYNRFDVRGTDGDFQLRAVLGAGNLYEVVGARPILGRLPRPDEERLPVVAISDRVWHDRFNAAPDVVGRRLVMYGVPYTIVGVMPAGFHFPTPDIDLWTTLYSIASSTDATFGNAWLTSRSMRAYRVVARLVPGATLAQAERTMNVVQQRLGETYPASDAGIQVHLQSLRDDTVGGVERALWTVFVAAGLILLLGCVNVAHLLLARLSARARELAVRRALGAHRWRVVRQLTTEGSVLGLTGGMVGVVAAFGAVHALVRLGPGDIPRLENVGIDGSTLGFALVVSLATGIAFGILPAFASSDASVHDSLRARGGAGSGSWAFSGKRLRNALTALEVAFAAVLLVGAGLMLRSFAELTSSNVGVAPANVSVAQVTFTGPRYRSDIDKSRAVDALLANLRAIPGVIAAGAGSSMPPSRFQEITDFEITGTPHAAPGHGREAIFIPASAGFVDALGISRERGRAFDNRDASASPPVAIVSAELVRRYFPRTDPIGHQIDVSGATRTIVGVVGDAVYEGVGAPMRPTIYVPFAQSPFPGAWIAIRSPFDAAALAPRIRAAIRAVDPSLPVWAPRSLDSMIAESVVGPRFHAWLLGAFGGLALLLAAIGVYGVIAYGVAQRRPELGIRLALGAPAHSIVSMVMRSGMTAVLVGLAIGLGAAYAGSRFVASLLYGITPTDAITFALVPIVLGLAALMAAYVPARRAARVNPLTAIRAE